MRNYLIILCFALQLTSCAQDFKSNSNVTHIELLPGELYTKLEVGSMYYPQVYIFNSGELSLFVPGYLEGIEGSLNHLIAEDIVLEENAIDPENIAKLVNSKLVDWGPNYTIVYFYSDTCKYCKSFERNQAELFEAALGEGVSWILISEPI